MSSEKHYDSPPSDFRQWLPWFMRRHRLSRTQIAAIANVDPKTVSEWKRGKGPIRPTETRALLIDTLETTSGEVRETIGPPVPRLRYVRPPTSAREKKVGTELAWRLVLIERDRPEQFRYLAGLIRSIRPLSDAEAEALKEYDFLVIKGGRQ